MKREFFLLRKKFLLINQAIAAGVKRLEVASFVHPKRVPQMANAEEVIAALDQIADVTYIGLILNERGLDRALATSVHEVGCVSFATDTFSQKNQGQTSDESVEVASNLIKRAKAQGLRANVTISAAFGCPFEGEVAIERVVTMAKQLVASGPHELAIADTIGVANPWHVTELLEAVKHAVGDIPLRLHFHNTRNTGIANVYAAIQAGAKTIDASIAGIGGCPFAPAATGNVPTEDVVYMLSRAGFETGLSIEALNATAAWLSETMQKSLPGMVSKAGNFPKEY